MGETLTKVVNREDAQRPAKGPAGEFVPLVGTGDPSTLPLPELNAALQLLLDSDENGLIINSVTAPDGTITLTAQKPEKPKRQRRTPKVHWYRL